MANRIRTKSGDTAIVQVTNGGNVVAESNGTFDPGHPFSLKNDGTADVSLVVRLAAQKSGETYNLLLRANSYFSEELVVKIISGLTGGHNIKWGS